MSSSDSSSLYIPDTDLQGAVDNVDTLVARFRECHAGGVTDVDLMVLAMIEAVNESGMSPAHIIGQQVLMLAVCLQRLAMRDRP